MQDVVFQIAIVALSSLVTAVIALYVISRIVGRQQRKAALVPAHPELEQTVFLFDGDELVDATGPARCLLEASPLASSDWGRLQAFLLPRFDTLTARLKDLPAEGRIELRGIPPQYGGPALRLIAETVNNMMRLTIIDPEAEGRGVLVDGLSQRALEDELDHLRHALDLAPTLVWQEDPERNITWANRAYLTQSGALDEADQGLLWPLPRLFDLDASSRRHAARRVMLTDQAGLEHWFEVQSFAGEDGHLHFAQHADSTVRAEKALRDFVQTLTKTFADLPIGLAIFDRNRHLRLFNPALIDLTTLGADFLSGRPSLYALLDRLREVRMMPEPKDYRSWREQMTELETQAAKGFHEETWSLPNGQTYRVTGRPHPDGAIAFLFENITSEVSLTRQFRAELETSQAVLDNISEAVAVFGAAGDLTLTNAAHQTLWGYSQDNVQRITMTDALRRWSERCERSAIWSQARVCFSRREPAQGEIRMNDGRRLMGRFTPMSGGGLMISFTPLVADVQPARTITGHLAATGSD
ncbi:hypothetical protein BFP70_14785 [Thioclava sp. SK-1]|uniref:PAS-domain containing protein n=1 Tax=Thioclava sp. SK-1 TaxID=1889770 RepID=UPI000826BDF7|nr:PAS-domain containing protein [Thioclava sp. SK-1]OCX61580.1 hypothetical protein BFP70_14785 [Thioclava sp. SK-1]